MPSPDQLLLRAQVLVTIFLGIFIEAVPFLLAGALVSGFIHVFVDHDAFCRFVPRQPLLATLAGALLGLAFPVCECGVVPVTRRLYQKGLPLSAGIAFLLAAPILNPIVIASTWTAFGWGPMLWGRLALAFTIASAVGMLFTLASPAQILLPVPPDTCNCEHDHHVTTSRLAQALQTAGDDFVDMGGYLVLGSLLAATMQTVVPQQTLLALGRGPVTSALTLLLLAAVLSVCSTVDSFLALAFVHSFASSSILGFLVFGPMVDIKSTLMYLGVFERRPVAYLILLPLLMTIVATLYLSLYVGW